MNQHSHEHSQTSDVRATDNEEPAFGPISMAQEPQATSPALSDSGSSMGPSNRMEDSFSFFQMTTLVKSFMEEKEVRGKHQAILIEMIEKSTEERTNVRE